jgi:CTP synthase
VFLDHPYFVGVQYHPEFLSSPFTPSPPFYGLVLAASGQLDGFLTKSRIPSPVEKLKNGFSGMMNGISN